MENRCNQDIKRKKGRHPKKNYDPGILTKELIDITVEVYNHVHEIKATANELSLPPNKVKKLLITGKAIRYPETEQIQSLQKQGKTMAEIQNIMQLSYSAIQTYLPYTKVIYKLSEISQNAERIHKYRSRKAAVDHLKEECTEENLWKCIVQFQEYLFFTSSGLPFQYTLRIGRNGDFTKELFINRRENSKSLSWGSVRIAFEKAMEKTDHFFLRPKDIADVRGISYVYSLLWRFGIIMVPENIEQKLKGIKG